MCEPRNLKLYDDLKASPPFQSPYAFVRVTCIDFCWLLFFNILYIVIYNDSFWKKTKGNLLLDVSFMVSKSELSLLIFLS